MSTRAIENAGVPVQAPSSEEGARVWRGILVGLIPLGVLAAVVLVSILLVGPTRVLFFSAGFFALQQEAVIVVIARVLLAVVVFGVVIWLQGEAKMAAKAALWTLGVTALVIVAPVVLAILLSQHLFT